MLKAEADKSRNIVEVVYAGDAAEIVTDVLGLINVLYFDLLEDSPDTAELLKFHLTLGCQDCNPVLFKMSSDDAVARDGGPHGNP